jgi:hypothetical protein
MILFEIKFCYRKLTFIIEKLTFIIEKVTFFDINCEVYSD